MSERACGIHALDTAPNDACPHCTRARIQARDEEIERLTAAWHAEMELSAKFQQELAEVKAECERIRKGVDYWSYCMSEGMRATCPEKVSELMDFLISLKIAPYYVRNKCLETVRADRNAQQLPHATT